MSFIAKELVSDETMGTGIELDQGKRNLCTLNDNQCPSNCTNLNEGLNKIINEHDDSITDTLRNVCTFAFMTPTIQKIRTYLGLDELHVVYNKTKGYAKIVRKSVREASKRTIRQNIEKILLLCLTAGVNGLSLLLAVADYTMGKTALFLGRTLGEENVTVSRLIQLVYSRMTDVIVRGVRKVCTLAAVNLLPDENITHPLQAHKVLITLFKEMGYLPEGTFDDKTIEQRLNDTILKLESREDGVFVPKDMLHVIYGNKCIGKNSQMVHCQVQKCSTDNAITDSKSIDDIVCDGVHIPNESNKTTIMKDEQENYKTNYSNEMYLQTTIKGVEAMNEEFEQELYNEIDDLIPEEGEPVTQTDQDIDASNLDKSNDDLQ